MNLPKKIRLLLVDDHSLVRMGFATVLQLEKDLEVTAEAEDADEALAKFREHRPDVTLMDARLPGASGVDAVRRIRTEFPEARIIMLTTFAFEETLFQALQAGAAGFLLKSVARAELVAEIHRVLNGERCIPEALQQRLSERMQRKSLSPRELEVLDLMRRGLSNRDISVALGIAEHTAKTHVKMILAKLEVADRAEAVAAGLERGLLEYRP